MNRAYLIIHGYLNIDPHNKCFVLHKESERSKGDFTFIGINAAMVDIVGDITAPNDRLIHALPENSLITNIKSL